MCGAQSCSLRKELSSVGIDQWTSVGLKTHLLGPAVGQPKRAPPEEFGRIPLEPYAPARWQLLNLHRAVNR